MGEARGRRLRHQAADVYRQLLPDLFHHLFHHKHMKRALSRCG
jgi:hypothetical protein